MSRRHDDDLRKLAETLQPASGGRGRRSPLFHWLYKRANAFQRLRQTTQASWASITAAVIALDLKDADGKPPTLRCVQDTWYSVCRAKGWLEKTSPPKPVPAASPASIPLSSLEARLNAFATDEAPAPARTFRTAALRNHVPSPTPPALPAQSSPQPDPDPDRANRVIKAMLSGAPRNRFRPDDGE